MPRAARSPDTCASVPSTGPLACPPTVRARTALTHSVIGFTSANAMSAGQDPLGALSLYSDQPYAFEAESEDLGFVWAAHAALAWSALRRDMQFRSALASR